MKNKYGLSRNIPNEIKRQIRQRCGFGCVVCGALTIQYEHIDPEFHEAKQHEPEKMTLLCPSCHQNVTSGFWSKNKVIAANRKPYCKKEGYAKRVLDFCCNHPKIVIGGVALLHCSIPIKVDGIPLIKIDDPECEDAPFRLSGMFADSSGGESLVICENECVAYSRAWDIAATGSRITIREALGRPSLVLRVDPPDSIIVEKLDMLFKGHRIVADPETVKFTHKNGGSVNLSNVLLQGFGVGFSFR